MRDIEFIVSMIFLIAATILMYFCVVFGIDALNYERYHMITFQPMSHDAVVSLAFVFGLFSFMLTILALILGNAVLFPAIKNVVCWPFRLPGRIKSSREAKVLMRIKANADSIDARSKYIDDCRTIL